MTATLLAFINERPKTDLDSECMQLIDSNINLMIPWYLMAAYAYYKEDDPIISDLMFDNLAKKIYNNWEDIEHTHKYLIKKDDLLAGTYLGEYPSIVSGALDEVRRVYKHGKYANRNSGGTKRSNNSRSRKTKTR